jgi:hypothetical protein
MTRFFKKVYKNEPTIAMFFTLFVIILIFKTLGHM